MVNEVLGKKPLTTRGGLKQIVTQVTLITIVIKGTKKKCRVPDRNEICARQRGVVEGERVLS